MSGEQWFGVVIVVIAAGVIAIVQLGKYKYRIKRYMTIRLSRLVSSLKGMLRNKRGGENSAAGSGLDKMSEEEKSVAELQRLQELIEDRKQVASESDISYHLWGLYRNHFRIAGHEPAVHHARNGEWYEIRILRSGENSGLNEFEFKLKGDRYRFVDDEERQGWSDNIKRFSLFLYDNTGRCLIEIPMRVRVDRNGRTYSIASGGPKAFLTGDWINDFINVKLKNQSVRNQQIRAQKHRERLSEIEDLKDRFGIQD
jgi:hypothetical protein